jgi:hypothetical protein
MFLLRWTTGLMSLPFLWAGQLAKMLQLPLSVPLLKAAWLIGGDGEVALLALADIQQKDSPEAARAQAAEWMASRPRPEIAAFAGLLAVQANDLESACDLLARGLESGQDRSGMLEMLQVFIAQRTGDPGALLEVARRFESRHDLSPFVSKFVQEQLMFDAMSANRFDEAEQRARRLWSIEDNPAAAHALWVLARRRGEQVPFGRYFDRLTLPEGEKLYLHVMGLLVLGEWNDAAQLLVRLEAIDPQLAAEARRKLQEKETVA